MEIELKIILPIVVSVIGLLYAAFWLGGNKRKKSDNDKADFDNRIDKAEDWLIRLEKTTDFAGKQVQTNYEYKSMILKVLLYGEMHFKSCENPKDDFKDYLDLLSKKFNNKNA